MRSTPRSTPGSTVEGIAIGAAAVAAMAVVAVAGVALAAPAAGAPARTGAAVVALAVGAPVDATVSGTAVPGGDRLPVRGGFPVEVSGTVEAVPLGVTVVGIAVLALLFCWRRRAVGDLPLAAGAAVGFVAGVLGSAWFGRGGPVDVGSVTLVFRAGVGRAVLGALVLAVCVLGALLLPAPWRRPVRAVAGLIGALCLLGTVVAVVVGAVAGGARAAGAALLVGADGVGLVPWAFGVPWRVDVDGPLAGALTNRIDDLGSAHWRIFIVPIATVAIFSSRMLTTERGWPTAARLGTAWAVGFAAVTVATGVSATAAATVFVLELPAIDMSLRGNVFVALIVGGVAGALVGLVPVRPGVPVRPRVRSHGVPPRRR